jgi:hypothetical protein
MTVVGVQYGIGDALLFVLTDLPMHETVVQIGLICVNV